MGIMYKPRLFTNLIEIISHSAYDGSLVVCGVTQFPIVFKDAPYVALEVQVNYQRSQRSNL